MEVSLMDILDAREARVHLQLQFLQECACPLVCFTMNIAGPIKTTPLIQRGFRAGLDALKAKLPKNSIRKEYVDLAPTGCTAMLAVDMDAHLLKNLCVSLEDALKAFEEGVKVAEQTIKQLEEYKGKLTILQEKVAKLTNEN